MFNVQIWSSPCDFQFVYGRVYLPRCGCRVANFKFLCANQPLLLICVDFLVFPNALKQYDILFLELIGWNQCFVYSARCVQNITTRCLPLLLICVDFLVFPNALKQYDILFLELIGWNQCFVYSARCVQNITTRCFITATLNSAHCVSAVWPIMKQRLPHGSSAVSGGAPRKEI
ncbi:Hypothetical_protein [Hexamita inflata]|uniref:Hypothetical_protein n=1 Tax=Hexamita inflata TaxID=28002 RepID=A0ABP1K2Z1_9EUKA